MKNYTDYLKTYLTRGASSLLLLLTLLFVMPAYVICQNLATVNLGTSGDYVMLAKTGISTSGTTSIVGNIGVSPVAATYITGFGLIMDPSGTFSRSSLITGKAYASDYTDPTPSNLTTAIGDMETAATDAANRKSPDFTELYAGDLTGQTLTPGLYKWGTNVVVSAGGVTISGTDKDIWIFQIAQDLVLANGANVYLTGGAQASNIFWQVDGQTTLGTTAAMQGIILCKTKIAMNTGASLNGRALAQTAVTTDANSISISGTTTSNDDLIPTEFALYQNYPNPFNPSTIIQYSLNTPVLVSLKIYSVLGVEVTTLVDKYQDAGVYSILFSATSAVNKNGNVANLASGVYFYRLEAGSFVETKKLILLR